MSPVVSERRDTSPTSEEEAHLAGVDVRAVARDVRVVREDDVRRSVRDLGDREARIAGDDNVRDLAVLARNAKAESLCIWVNGKHMQSVSVRERLDAPLRRRGSCTER